MALSDILNKGACGLDTQRGFNTNKGCSIPFKDITELWLTPSGFKFDETRDFTEEYIREVQAEGNLTVLKNVQLFENQSTDNQFSTTNRGFKELAIEGIYEFKASFTEDIWFNSVLGSLEGKRNKRIFLISNGSIFGTEATTEGNFRGMLAYSITRSIQTFTQGTDPASQYLEIQFASKKEIDDKPVVLGEDTLSFSTDDIEPIVDVEVKFNAVPVDAGTSIFVDLFTDRGLQSISGVSFDFDVYVNDVLQTVSGVTGSPTYNIAISPALATNDVVKVSLSGVQDVTGDCLYVSNTATSVAIASN